MLRNSSDLMASCFPSSPRCFGLLYSLFFGTVFGVIFAILDCFKVQFLRYSMGVWTAIFAIFGGCLGFFFAIFGGCLG